MKIAHLTDIHVADENDYGEPHEAHWRAKIHKHSERLLERLLADMAEQKPDHVVLTGDLTLTSKKEEFERARAYLDAGIPGIRVSALPGNHDRWRAEAMSGRWFEQSFGDRVSCDLGGDGFPYCHLAGDVAFVGLDSSPYDASSDPSDVKGRVSEVQLRAFERLGKDPRISSRFVVVLLHHHLRLSAEDASAEDPKDPTPLENAPEVEEALARIPVGVVLHGHRHKQMRLDLAVGGRQVPILCPGSATRVDERPDRTSRYGVYTVEAKALREVRTRAYVPSSDRFEWI
ncbi:metallophosphoesterase family protein [Vulgatibacter incomptus]|uniref:Metallophosphoesterase n=1 Tax=Vulgatibacter incomptus TaxID=1391653 RepID=A0A0K1PC18_9BACT|nr:metallophosphoesterase [Vulgatibacter incomptus]AKU91047.1 metallophosphoesterase [Vulgatibacter incomptus]